MATGLHALEIIHRERKHAATKCLVNMCLSHSKEFHRGFAHHADRLLDTLDGKLNVSVQGRFVFSYVSVVVTCVGDFPRAQQSWRLPWVDPSVLVRNLHKEYMQTKTYLYVVMLRKIQLLFEVGTI